MIAALFVATDGPYFGLLGVDPWDEARDAKRYRGPYPVVAHPPCQRWGRYWSGGPNPSAKRRTKGDDDGCFMAAFKAVTKYGGVLEHPEASHAWFAFGLPKPPKRGGWVQISPGRWTCCVEQGNYGHPCRKATWLYYVGPKPPELKWGKALGRTHLDTSFNSKAEAKRVRAERKALGVKPPRRPSDEDRIHTPILFRQLLLRLARASRQR